MRKVGEDAIRKIMAEVLEIPVDGIASDANMQTLGAWDSIHHLQLILALENGLDVSFTPDETVEITSLQAICNALRSHDVEVAVK